MECNGRVLSTQENMAKVEMRREGCGGCTACHIGSLAEREDVIIDARNEVHAQKDDLVHLEISGRTVMHASAIIFMLPLTGFLIGFLIGYYPLWLIFESSRELVALGCGFALMGLSYIPVRYLGNKSEFDFEIIDVMERPG
ncbi:MAG: SoxR reducing system RseC family protein [Actinobacteria bacterium]|nr:SoxR reducing system RseC family protein [Actinomycetota bacterium]